MTENPTTDAPAGVVEHKSLAAALAAFQGEMPSVHKGNTANVPTKSGGSYRYTYADLADVSKAAMPILARHGLSFTTSPGIVDGKLMLTGTLLHTSGEHREGMLPLTGGGPQELGSSLTYMRRYLLGALTGIVTDDDDDGQRAEDGARRQQQQQRQPARQQQREVDPNVERITAVQSRRMGQLTRQVGLADKVSARAFVVDVIGREVNTTSELTIAEADRVLAELEAEAKRAAADKAPAESEQGTLDTGGAGE